MPSHRVSFDLPSRWGATEDAALVAMLASGEDAALDELIRRHGDRLCSYLARLVRDGSWADDLLQEVFVRVLDAARSYDGTWPVRVWLFGIARNLAVDWLRREGLRQSRLRNVAPAESAPSAARAVEQREFQDALADAIELLPEGFRSVFLLREQEGLSYEEIAAVLRISAKTVSSRLHRARLFLRDRMKRYWAS